MIRNLLPFAFVGVVSATAPAQAAPCSVANCETCSSSDANLCLICKGGFGLDAGSCYDASVTCSNSLFNQQTGINKDGTCCQELNCMECSTASMCTQCNEGYHLDNRGRCEKCPINQTGPMCVQRGCHSSQRLPTSCCPENCAICNEQGTCLVCHNGDTTPTCPHCVEGDTPYGCAVCGDDKCEICNPGFTWSQFGCRPCPDNCTEGCGKPVDGLPDIPLHCCRRVQGNCGSCNYNPAVCEKCNLGFYSFNLKCNPCHESCVSCMATHNPTADYCCSANCAACDGDGCNICFGGFTLDRATKTCS